MLAREESREARDRELDIEPLEEILPEKNHVLRELQQQKRQLIHRQSAERERNCPRPEEDQSPEMGGGRDF